MKKNICYSEAGESLLIRKWKGGRYSDGSLIRKWKRVHLNPKMKLGRYSEGSIIRKWKMVH